MLVPNIIEVRTPPPPMYEEEMEEQKRLENQPKYNKEFYASSDSESLSSIASEDESENENTKKTKNNRKSVESQKQKKKKKRKHKKHEKPAENENQQNLVSSKYGKISEGVKLPEINITKHASKEIRKPGVASTKASKPPISINAAGPNPAMVREKLTVHSIRSLASELLVKSNENHVINKVFFLDAFKIKK